jgi:hypothetical protein
MCPSPSADPHPVFSNDQSPYSTGPQDCNRPKSPGCSLSSGNEDQLKRGVAENAEKKPQRLPRHTLANSDHLSQRLPPRPLRLRVSLHSFTFAQSPMENPNT